MPIHAGFVVKKVAVSQAPLQVLQILSVQFSRGYWNICHEMMV